ncbi:MAG: hypothetical protein JWM11_2139 [Planctomycetaceae bacterium]|nr:hypothetical protein [Planctomycetaceae bacterium]
MIATTTHYQAMSHSALVNEHKVQDKPQQSLRSHSLSSCPGKFAANPAQVPVIATHPSISNETTLKPRHIAQELNMPGR